MTNWAALDDITTDTKIAIFKGRQVRKTIYKNEWWFVVEDVVLALTDTPNPKDYINKMRLRDNELSKGYGQFVHTLPIETLGGKQKMNCANTEGIFRIVQSIPSPKAEPFKRWLARVEGGDIAGGARKKLEKRLGRSLVSKQNYLPKKQNPNQLQWGPPT